MPSGDRDQEQGEREGGPEDAEDVGGLLAGSQDHGPATYAVAVRRVAVRTTCCMVLSCSASTAWPAAVIS
jgi:hypothetical protein